jgi:2-polyprenyl-3-methyl-5-hydroxy-6-metoxy-1,4-benzoquinol methylase
MERAEWLKQMREKAEILYDYEYNAEGLELDEGADNHRDETTVEYIRKLLGNLAPRSTILTAGCGNGLYDGILVDAGHNVVGTDFSEESLKQARRLHPMIRYVKMAHHELNFQNEFDGVICIDSLPHVFPEEWPVIMQRFRKALKPGGLLYFTIEDASTMEGLRESYEQAKAKGLPVVFGEVVDELEECYQKVMETKPEDLNDLPAGLRDKSVYHFNPSVEQVRDWLEQERFEIEEVGRGTVTFYSKHLNESLTYTDYHFIVRKGEKGRSRV